jgi:hypothetical protein
MNMTLQLDIEGVFSADRQDIVGAFINGECRGLAKMQYEPTLNKWLAFLTVYSNNFTGDSIKRMIDEIGRLFGAKASAEGANFGEIMNAAENAVDVLEHRVLSVSVFPHCWVAAQRCCTGSR